MTKTPAELISEFRMIAHTYFPYLSTYTYSLVPVERVGLGTMAVDQNGRMYYDPDFCEQVTLDQGAYVVLHEAWHLILRHCHRREGITGANPTAYQRRQYNIAVDLVVWEVMEAMAQHMPEGGVDWPKMSEMYPKLERNMLPGEIYTIITEDEDAPPPSKQAHKEEEGNEESEAGKEESEAGPNADGEPGNGDSKPDPSGSDQEGNGPGGDSDDSGGAEDGSPKPPGDPFKLIGGGSGADGIPCDYEEEPNPAWDAFIEDRLLGAIEKKIEEHEQCGGRGSIPGQLKEVIKNKLRPQPNPWNTLRATIARAALNPRGAKDWTYQKVNRRQFAMPDAPRLKGCNTYSPKAVVVIDTSGSMSTECKRKCVQVMADGLRAVGDFRVIFGDTCVRADVKWTAMKNEVAMPGGGGTNMVSLIEYAEKEYKPDIIVIGTDGGTSWPLTPTKAQLVIALTQDLDTPKWATRVFIPDEKGST